MMMMIMILANLLRRRRFILQTAQRFLSEGQTIGVICFSDPDICYDDDDDDDCHYHVWNVQYLSLFGCVPL